MKVDNLKEQSYTSWHKTRRRWNQLLVILSFFVLLGTGYALTLPADTMTRLVCELEEHTHSDSCYDNETGALICELEEHVHEDPCYIAEPETTTEEETTTDEAETDPVYIPVSENITIVAGDFVPEEYSAVPETETSTVGQTNSEELQEDVDYGSDAETAASKTEGQTTDIFSNLTDEDDPAEEQAAFDDTPTSISYDDSITVSTSESIDTSYEDSASVYDSENSTDKLDKTGELQANDGYLNETESSTNVSDNSYKEDFSSILETDRALDEQTIPHETPADINNGKDTEVSSTETSEKETEESPDDSELEDLVEDEVILDAPAIMYFAQNTWDEEGEDTRFDLFGNSSDSSDETNPATELDFTNWIKEIELQRKNDANIWVTITDGIINKDDYIRFRINYQIPAGGLSGIDTITYTIPDGMKTITEEKEPQNVINSSSQTIGTYTIIDGIISITFDSTYVTGNASSLIDGYVSFDGTADEQKSDATGKQEFKFSESVTYTVQIEDKKITTEDLKIQKEILSKDVTTGTINYQINISSENGTASKVVLKDTMENIILYGNVVVEGVDSSVFSEIDSGYTITLPQMEAGKKYIR